MLPLSSLGVDHKTHVWPGANENPICRGIEISFFRFHLKVLCNLPPAQQPRDPMLDYRLTLIERDGSYSIGTGFCFVFGGF